jgi:hypothetical protein
VQVKVVSHSLQSVEVSSCKCTLVLAHKEFETYLTKQNKHHHQLFLLMKLMPSERKDRQVLAVEEMMKEITL